MSRTADAASIEGLDTSDFIDKNDRHLVKRQNGDVRLKSATDSVYLNTQQELSLLDPTLKRRISIKKDNSLTTVVWNPWAEKSRAMSDLGPDKWKEFICIEASNVAPYSVNLESGQQHTMAALIQVAP